MSHEKSVTVDREDLKRVLRHCRETWSRDEAGLGAVMRCEEALGMERVWVNLFMVDRRIVPSISYATKQDAEAHTNNATSFVVTISIEVPRRG